MTYRCINGMQHTWQPTGRWWRIWSATGTRASSMPANAPLAREEVCPVCGAARTMLNAPFGGQYNAEAVA